MRTRSSAARDVLPRSPVRPLLHTANALSLLCGAACLTIGLSGTAALAETARGPNVIFILADDLGYSARTESGPWPMGPGKKEPGGRKKLAAEIEKPR